MIVNDNSVNTEEVATSDNTNINNDDELNNEIDEILDPINEDIDKLLIVDDDENKESNENDEGNIENEINIKNEKFNSNEQSKNKNNEFNSKFAQMRRENEELKRKTELANKYLSNLYQEQGIKDLDSFNTYMQNFEETQRKNEYKERGIDIDTIDKVIADRIKESPELQQLKKMQEQRKVELEVQEFEQNYPNFKDVKNVQELPNFEKVLEFRNKHNLSLTDAFTLANKDNLQEILKQETLKLKNDIKNDLISKQNRTLSNGSNSGNANPIVITKSDLNVWKKFYPGKSDEELKKIIYKSKTRK